MLNAAREWKVSQVVWIVTEKTISDAAGMSRIPTSSVRLLPFVGSSPL